MLIAIHNQANVKLRVSYKLMHIHAIQRLRAQLQLQLQLHEHFLTLLMQHKYRSSVVGSIYLFE